MIRDEGVHKALCRASEVSAVSASGRSVVWPMHPLAGGKLRARRRPRGQPGGDREAGCDDGEVDYVDALVNLGRVTAEQWGLATGEQAEQVGVDASCLDGLVHKGVLVVAGEGVFQLAGAPLPPHLDIKVAWLQLEPGMPAWRRMTGNSGVVSHSSACRLHELGELPSGTVEIFAAAGSGAVEAGVRLHHEPGPDPAQITVVDGLPVTTAGRTIADLLRAGLDGGHVGGVVADAARRGLVDLRTLAQEVAVFAPAYGLPASASGHDLISHLLADAGEQAPASLVG